MLMGDLNHTSHWERVYDSKAPAEVSWFQREADLSLELIHKAAPSLDSAIIDVGAGASTLVDGLIRMGYHQITLLDVSATALRHTQQRLVNTLPEAADSVVWRHADVLTAALRASSFDVWHDRAVFHFLTDASDRRDYVKQVRDALRHGGYLLVATFADDGPTRCSGLDVQRYSPAALHSEFGPDFRPVEDRREEHHTPWEAIQAFTYCLFQYNPTRHDQ